MTEFFEQVGNIIDFFLHQLDMVGSFFKIALNAFQYLFFTIYSLPVYMQAFVVLFACAAIVLMVLNRG